MVRKHRSSVWLLVLLLVMPGLASAARKGRLIGVVLDPDGNPIEGVTVTATSEQVAGFKEVEVTDQKGVFKVDFDEINIVYRYQFDKVGYATLKAEQTWRKDGTARHKFVMQPGESAVAAGDVPVASAVAPAVQAYNAGAAAFQAKDYASAVTSFQEAVKLDPEFGKAWGALSVAQLEAEDYQAAVEAAEKAMDLGDADLLVLRTRWEAYRNLGDEAKTAEAQAAVEKAGILAEEAKRIFNEAVSFVKADDHEAAYAKFKEASELNPNLQEALLGVATTALETERFEEAQAAAAALIEDDPQHEQAIRVRYNAALQTKDDRFIFDALVSLAPFEPEVARTGLWNLARAPYEANEMEVAKERFTKLLGVEPVNPQCYYYLGLINLREGAEAEAKKFFERFVELAPDDPEAGTARDFLAHLG